MAALTAQTARRLAPGGFSWPRNWRIADTIRVYIGSFCGIPGTGGFTSTRGFLRPWSNVATTQWAGVCTGFNFPANVVDINAGSLAGATAESPDPEAVTEAGPVVLENYSVTGVSAQADLRLSVYATNDNDLTVTANIAPIVGRIIYYRTSTNCDVLFYGYLASVVI